MSLINEALKRAKQSHGRQVGAPAAGPPLQPVAEVSSVGRPMFAWMVPAAAGASLILGTWFLVLSWRPSATATAPQSLVPRMRTEAASKRSRAAEPQASAKAAVPARVVSNAVAVPVASTKETVAEVRPPVAEPPVERVDVRAPVAAPTPVKDVAPPVSESVPVAPEFKLQGIFYRISKASALIDGRTLFVGDEIDGAKVVLIERHSVRLVRDGRSIVLKLR
ncbi:MAG: hypothetical protein AB9869_07135 [Verrucomicrobiia bacterium]